MLKENQYVHTIWNSSNKRHLISKGYIFTKMYDDVLVKAEDLSNGSRVKVVCLCDYCGQEIIKQYREHIKHGDCCRKCFTQKVKNTVQSRYGVDNVMDIQNVKDKVKQTNLNIYGCTCTVHNPEIQSKVKQTNIERYGSEYYFGSEKGKQDIQQIIDNRTEDEKQDILNKMQSTCLEKYGTCNASSSDLIKQKIININMKKYGVPYVIMNEDVKEKQVQSMINNRKNRTSKQEKKCYNIIKKKYTNCKPSVRCGKYTLDYVINYKDIKIDIEYDGWYWHQKMQEHDDVRNKFVLDKGYKIIRIISDGKMPTLKQLQNAIDDITNGQNIVYIDISNHTQS